MPLVLVHEVRDDHGGCEFERFFAVTPPDLAQAQGLYRQIATPLHASERHLAIALSLIASQLGAAKLPHDKSRTCPMDVVQPRQCVISNSGTGEQGTGERSRGEQGDARGPMVAPLAAKKHWIKTLWRRKGATALAGGACSGGDGHQAGGESFVSCTSCSCAQANGLDTPLSEAQSQPFQVELSTTPIVLDQPVSPHVEMLTPPVVPAPTSGPSCAGIASLGSCLQETSQPCSPYGQKAAELDGWL